MHQFGNTKSVRFIGLRYARAPIRAYAWQTRASSRSRAKWNFSRFSRISKKKLFQLLSHMNEWCIEPNHLSVISEYTIYNCKWRNPSWLMSSKFRISSLTIRHLPPNAHTIVPHISSIGWNSGFCKVEMNEESSCRQSRAISNLDFVLFASPSVSAHQLNM